MNCKRVVCGMALVILAVQAAAMDAPPSSRGKLDAQLANIARAAAARRVPPGTAQAPRRQLFHRNSPLAARWNAAGQVQVYLHADRRGGLPNPGALTALGATGIVESPKLNVVQAWIPARQLEHAAQLTGVRRVTLPRYAVVKRSPPGSALPRTGSVDSQGDQILNAARFRQLTGYSGQGVAVGVISDGDDHIAAAQSTGDLPADIWNDPSDSGSFASAGDEGTAMMEVVYDLAPAVQLGFCGPQTSVDFVTCLDDFVKHFGNSNLVIVDDLGFPGVAMFTDGGFAEAVKNFAMANPAVSLVTAAGNDAEGFWAGDWDPMSLPNAAVNNGRPITINGISYSRIQNFGSPAVPVTQLTVSVPPGDTLTWTLEWGDAWIATDRITGDTPNDPNNYDVILADSNGNVLVCNIGMNFGTAASPPSPASCPYSGAAAPTNTPGPQPIQGNFWQNTGGSPARVNLEILYAADGGRPDPHLKVLANTANHQINLQPSTPAGSIYGHSALPYPYEITAGAVAARNNPGYQIEAYSSQGPVFLFQPAVGSSMRMKPDFVGVGCVATTGAGNFSEPFCGTSAAAPHIAALIALFESAFPSANPYSLLQAGATPLGAGNPDNIYGYGLPNAASSAASQSPAPAASITSPSGNTDVAPNQAIHFTGQCAGNGAPGTLSYHWNFGANSGIPDATTPDTTAAYAADGQYTVTLTCTNAFGASGRATLAITVGGSSGKTDGGGLGPLAFAVLILMELAVARRPRTTAHMD